MVRRQARSIFSWTVHWNPEAPPNNATEECHTIITTIITKKQGIVDTREDTRGIERSILVR